MNKTRSRWSATGIAGFPTLMVFASLAVVLSATAYAHRESQKKSADNSVIYSERVGTAQASGSQVTLKLTFDNGAVFKVTQYEGAAIRVSRNGSTVLIASHLDSENPSRVQANIFKVFPVEATGVNVGESIAEIGSLHIGMEASEFNEGGIACKIELFRIVVATKTAEDRDELSRVHPMAGQGGECCLTCGGVTVCGCAVEGSCGSCCLRSCCGGLYG